jgi:hypothetical protein
MLTTEIILCWRTIHICQHVYILFVFPHYYWHVTHELSLYVTSLHFQFLSKIPRHSFPIYGLSKSGDEKKLSMKSLCLTCSITAISSVIVACADITVTAAHFLPLPNIS